ncbi:hypothetical protein MAPG_00861 [Magnaporthiopsis poae ATCC 64411]|uniref:Rhodopsin domain-containing protein n=1 Tax=Magnaporthiopsis poae (strain ATCC 64411 / 73-15) TaxID=644358 RepID=A0A0C4DM59_MAGP6|nr:hypothetical protein MAPG_00861 [Magnaporthiopsis poae ATCC 64411]
MADPFLCTVSSFVTFHTHGILDPCSPVRPLPPEKKTSTLGAGVPGAIMVSMTAPLWTLDNWGPAATTAAWSMFGILLVVVSLRMYTRAFVLKQIHGGGLYMDDYITAVCFFIFAITCVLVTVAHSYGSGRHMKDIHPQENVKEALKWNVISSAVLIWTFSLPKFAVIATLQRILDFGIRTTVVFWGLAITSQGCILGVSVFWFTQCRPIAKQWDSSVDGVCSGTKVFSDLGYFVSAYSAFLDIFFGLYPIPFIMRLNMPLKSRITVSTSLGLGVVACLVSLYKLIIFGEIFQIVAKDPTYPIPFLNMLGLAEGSILIVCASVPTLGPLYRKARGKFTDRYGSGSGESQVGRKKTVTSDVSSMAGGGAAEFHSNKNWSTFDGGHNPDDPERGRRDVASPDSAVGGRIGAHTRNISTMTVDTNDDIPLVRNAVGGKNRRSSSVLFTLDEAGAKEHHQVSLANPGEQRVGVAL